MKPSEQIEQLNAKLKQIAEENAKLKAQVALLSPVMHPVSKTNYVFAFEIEGEKFYKWQSVSDIPTSRKIYIDGLMQSTSMVMPVPDQKYYWSEVLGWSQTENCDNIKLVAIEALKRIEALPLPKLIFKAMSLLYLKPDDEIELNLPLNELERRATLFEKKKIDSLLEACTLPMSSIIGLQEITKGSIHEYSQKEKMELIKTIQAQEFLAEYSKKAIAALQPSPGSSQPQK